MQYRPRTLDDLHYHPELSSRLRSLVCLREQHADHGCPVGGVGGLSSHPLLWTLRSGQEGKLAEIDRVLRPDEIDENNVHAPGALRTRSGKGALTILPA